MSDVEIVAGKIGKYNDRSKGWEEIYVPRVIYFYYGNEPNLRVYMWVEPDDKPIKITDLDTKVKYLIENAYKNGQCPGPIGFHFEQVPWWRRSYLVFAVEGADGIDPNYPTIERDDGHPNHCFFDGGYKKDVETGIPMKKFSYIWTVDYMKTKSGKDIPPGQVHKFNFRFALKNRKPFDDPDHGTNMGPPIGPP